MVVAVMKGLNHIAESLRELGYDVVTYGEYFHNIDALVYVGKEMAGFTVSSDVLREGQQGVLMVNATNKNIAEISDTLKRRLYSPLF